MKDKDQQSVLPKKPSFEEWQEQRRGKKKGPSLDQRLKNSDVAFYRFIYRIIHSVAIVFIAIGSFLAWLISFLLL